MARQRRKTNNKQSNAPEDKPRRGRNYGDSNSRSGYRGDKSTHNDVSWYTPDNQILQDVARLPYSIPTGMPISRAYINQGSNGLDWSIPGILVQKIMPTLGYANSPSDPVNIAAQGIYSFVRHLNSGSRNYDPVDAMIYIGALDSVYSLISWCTRIYATICSYAQGNRYLPRILMASQGLDFDSFANNMVQFRSQLNQRIAKASQLMVPKVMPIFERHRWLFANYYIEGDDIKDQIYLYAPIGFYKFQLDNDSAGMLKAVSLKSIRSQLTYTDLIQLLDDMLDPIIADEDFNIMSGDIFKAYQGNIVTYSLVPDLIAMNFTYDENVLLQFKNSKSMPVGLDSNGNFLNNFFDYVQDSTKRYLTFTYDNAAIKGFMDPFLGFRPYDSTASNVEKRRTGFTLRTWSRPMLITSPHRDVSAEENMVSTRGTMAAEVYIGADYNDDKFSQVFFGSEWYERFETWTAVRRRSDGQVVFQPENFAYVVSLCFDLDGGAGATEIEFWMDKTIYNYANLTKFKYHPETWLIFNGVFNNQNMHNSGNTTSYFEVDNYCVVGPNVIKGMHDAALLGEYNVPRIALLPS